MRTPTALLVCALAASTLAWAPSAQAVSYVDVQAPDTTLVGDTCKDVDVVATGDWNADQDNEVNIIVYEPDGDWYNGQPFDDDTSGTVSATFNMCGQWTTPGTYRVDVLARGFDENDNQTSSQTGTSTFDVSVKPKKDSKVSADRRRIDQGKWKYAVDGKLTRAGKVYRHQEVCLQVKSQGAWADVECDSSNRRGKVSWSFKPNNLTWRYKFPGNDTTKADASPTFRTPGSTRAMARMTAAPTPRALVHHS